MCCTDFWEVALSSSGASEGNVSIPVWANHSNPERRGGGFLFCYQWMIPEKVLNPIEWAAKHCSAEDPGFEIYI